MKGHPHSVDALATLSEDVIVTGSSDGLVRVVQVLPNKLLGVIANHGTLPIERLRTDRTGVWLGSASHDNILKMTDVGDALVDSDADDSDEDELHESNEKEGEGEGSIDDNSDLVSEQNRKELAVERDQSEDSTDSGSESDVSEIPAAQPDSDSEPEPQQLKSVSSRRRKKKSQEERSVNKKGKVDAGFFNGFLGRGAFGEVYLAQHYSTGQLLACKCINKKSATSNKIRAEIEIMKDIQHPLVCQYVEAFENEKTIQILLELAAGGNLLQYIINKGAGGIREVETKPIAAQASIAMEYLHAKGITHRDLKPDNILLTRTTPPLVKIADFGFAKVIDKNSMLQTQCGTAIYIAPEVFIRTGRTGYDHKVDCWSLGLVVTAMLLGKHPFSSQRDLHEMHNYEMKHWETLTKRFSSKCVHWLQHMVTVDPADRMDMTQAVNHAWLASSAESLGYGRREPRESQTTSTNSTSTVGDGNPSAHPSSQVLQQFNESMSSMTIGNPSQASTSELGTPFLSSSVTTTTNAEDASWPDLIGGLSASTSTSLGIPGAFPHAAAAHTGGTSCPDLVGELTAGTSTLLPIPGAFPRSLEGQPEDSPANHPRREEASSSTMGAGAHRNDRRSLRLRRGKGGVLGRLPRGG
ncbi:hypothetical protein FRC11_006457 [Ceratobasidium sp. 423]|nr:hypothetical protein FRC11_006457 [Ceratobasidium sp. 423]